MAQIDNFADIIDSRDIIARIEHLAQLREPGPVDLGDDNDTDQDTLFAELDSLEKLVLQASQYADDWEYGAQLIRDSYFLDEYVKELVIDCGYFPNNKGIDWSAWPYRCIDWDQVAFELTDDYTEIDFDGVSYWVR